MVTTMISHNGAGRHISVKDGVDLSSVKGGCQAGLTP